MGVMGSSTTQWTSPGGKSWTGYADVATGQQANNPTSAPSSNNGSGGSSLSLRDAVSKLGGSSSYDPNTNMVNVSANGKNLSFQNGASGQYGLSGNDNGSNMVGDFGSFAKALGYSPIRDAFQSAGFNVGYNPGNRQVSLTDPTFGKSTTLGANDYVMGNDGHSYASQDQVNNVLGAYQSAVQAKNQMASQGLFQQDPTNTKKDFFGQLQDFVTAQMSKDPSTMVDKNSITSQVNGQVDPWLNQQLGNLQQQRANAQRSYNTAVSQAAANEQDNSRQLDDKYFQSYLAARQAIAERGLAGSGLSNDSDTRLSLAKQREMAGIEKQMDVAKQDALSRFNDQQQQLDNQQMDYSNQANEKKQGLLSSLYKDALNTASQNQNQKLGTLSDLLKGFAPYNLINQTDVVNNKTKMDIQGMKSKDSAIKNLAEYGGKTYDQNGNLVDSIQKTNQDRNYYASIGLMPKTGADGSTTFTATPEFQLKLDQFGLQNKDSMAKNLGLYQVGVDSEGNPVFKQTIDATHLQNEDAHAKAMEGIDWAKVDLQGKGLDQQIADSKQRAIQWAGNLTNEDNKQKATILASKMDKSNQQVLELAKLKNQGVTTYAGESIDEAIAQAKADSMNATQDFNNFRYTVPK